MYACMHAYIVCKAISTTKLSPPATVTTIASSKASCGDNTLARAYTSLAHEEALCKGECTCTAVDPLVCLSMHAMHMRAKGRFVLGTGHTRLPTGLQEYL